MPPPYWRTITGSDDLGEWQLIVEFLKAQGVTFLFPAEYVRMLNEPAYVASEEASDTTAPVISAIGSDTLSTTGARIIWATDEPATSQVEYGLTTSYGTSSTADSTLVTSHSVDITGLTANTLYHYRVKSTDGSNNPATGTDNTFTTPNTSTPAPVISAVTDTIITNG